MSKEPRSPFTVLEFNCTTIRVCRSAIVKGKRVVTHCFSFEAKDSESSTPEKIRQEFKNRGLVIKAVVLALPRYAAASRLMRLPSIDKEELKEMVRLRISRESFGTSIENIVYDWRRIGFDKDGYALVSVFLMQKETIRRYICILEKAGVFASKITLNTAGLLNWSCQPKATQTQAGAKCLYLLNADHDTFDFNLLLGGHSVFSRTFVIGESGLPDYSNRLSKELKVSFELARRLTAGYFEHDDKLYLTGTTKALADKGLENCFHRPTVSFLEITPVSYAAVTGLALRATTSIDLTPDETKAKIKEVERSLAIYKAMRSAVVITIAAFLFLFHAMDKKINHTLRLEQELKNKALIESQAQQALLMDFLEKNILKDKHFFGIFYELYRLSPPSVFLSDLEIEEGKGLIVSGTSPEPGAIFEFLGLLRGSGLFKGIRLDNLEDRELKGEKKIKFKIKSKSS
ncbi:MAG: PilN domain-containing protein [Candidatus Omnitrophota bacterium]